MSSTTTILRPGERRRSSRRRNFSNSTALNTGEKECANLPVRRATAPKQATDWRVGACRSTGPCPRAGSTCGSGCRGAGSGTRPRSTGQRRRGWPACGVFLKASDCSASAAPATCGRGLRSLNPNWWNSRWHCLTPRLTSYVRRRCSDSRGPSHRWPDSPKLSGRSRRSASSEWKPFRHESASPPPGPLRGQAPESGQKPPFTDRN